MAKKVFGAAVSGLTLAADLARHLAWYVAHQVDGRPRQEDEDSQSG